MAESSSEGAPLLEGHLNSNIRRDINEMRELVKEKGEDGYIAETIEEVRKATDLTQNKSMVDSVAAPLVVAYGTNYLPRLMGAVGVPMEKIGKYLETIEKFDPDIIRLTASTREKLGLTNQPSQ